MPDRKAKPPRLCFWQILDRKRWRTIDFRRSVELRAAGILQSDEQIRFVVNP